MSRRGKRSDNYTAADAQAIAFCLCIGFTLAVTIFGFSCAIIDDGVNSTTPELMRRISESIKTWDSSHREEFSQANFYLREEQKFELIEVDGVTQSVVSDGDLFSKLEGNKTLNDPSVDKSLFKSVDFKEELEPYSLMR
jgi:hypothetical protein